MQIAAEPSKDCGAKRHPRDLQVWHLLQRTVFGRVPLRWSSVGNSSLDRTWSQTWHFTGGM